MSITVGNWSVGKPGGVVVSDTIPVDYNSNSGHDDKDYYGGFLIAESMKKEDAEFLAASKNIFLQAAEVLKEINRDDLQSVRELKKLISTFI